MKYIYKKKIKETQSGLNPTFDNGFHQKSNYPAISNGAPPIKIWKEKNPAYANNVITQNQMSPPTPLMGKERSTRDDNLYCVCRLPHNPNEFMIGCDYCEEWYHGKCIGISPTVGNNIDKYACDKCREEDPTRQTEFSKKRGRSEDPNDSSMLNDRKPKKRKLNEQFDVKVSELTPPPFSTNQIHVAPPPPLVPREDAVPDDKIRCFCGSRKNFSKAAMTMCGDCGFWFHDMCLGVISANLVQSFVCRNCIIKKNTLEEAAKTEKTDIINKKKKKKKKKKKPPAPVKKNKLAKTKDRGRGRKRGRGRGRGRGRKKKKST